MDEKLTMVTLTLDVDYKTAAENIKNEYYNYFFLKKKD